MSQWFKERRQEFIIATFKQFGQIRRADLMRQFGITAAVASSDIATFLEANPITHKFAVVYDVSAKCYVLVGEDD